MNQTLLIAPAIRMTKTQKIYVGTRRHTTCIRAAILAGEDTPLACDYGFITRVGKFLTREEAADALNLTEPLYSETLWP